MTAYAAFQNLTERSFQNGKEGFEVNLKKNEKSVKSRDNYKKAER